jgi:hypothetical protein
MSKTVEVQSPEQFNELLGKSRIVVADCEYTALVVCPSSTPLSSL